MYRWKKYEEMSDNDLLRCYWVITTNLSGQIIPKQFWPQCEKNLPFFYDGFLFNSSNYIKVHEPKSNNVIKHLNKGDIYTILNTPNVRNQDVNVIGTNFIINDSNVSDHWIEGKTTTYSIRAPFDIALGKDDIKLVTRKNDIGTWGELDHPSINRFLVSPSWAGTTQKNFNKTNLHHGPDYPSTISITLHNHDCNSKQTPKIINLKKKNNNIIIK